MADAPSLTVPSVRARPARALPIRLRVRSVRRVGGLLALVAAWEAYARTADNRLTPSVTKIWDRLVDLTTSGDLWFHGRLTLQRGGIGLAIATVAGIAVGLAMARSRLIGAMLQPVLSALYPVPKIALYPVLIAMFGIGGTAKVWQVALECFFPIAYNTFGGASRIDRSYVWLARGYRAGQLRTARDVIIPTALPSILTGLRVAAPIALIVITVTEIIGESRGLGFLISNAQANFRPDEALAVVVVLGIIGFTIDRLIVFASGRLVFWEKGLTE